MKVDLIDSMGSDLTTVNAAKVSFDKASDWENNHWGHQDFDEPNYLSQKDTKLTKYLADHGHFTPFTHSQITMRETVPIFVARQRFKHMVGFTYNEVSRRYVDSEPEFFTPDKWRNRAENKKQGSGVGSVELEGVKVFPHNLPSYSTDIYQDALRRCLEAYKSMIKSGVAPEQARMVLPQSMYTSYYVTGSLYAFARAYNLRSKEDSQFEIQLLAKEWDKIIRPLFPVSWGMLTDGS